jgi:hypothetical protein
MNLNLDLLELLLWVQRVSQDLHIKTKQEHVEILNKKYVI